MKDQSQTLFSTISNHNEDAEFSVIGSILVDQNVFIIAKEHILSSNYFYNYQCRLLWQAINELMDEGIPIDDVTIYNKLKKEIDDNKITQTEIDKIYNRTPTSANCKYYSEIVAEYYKKRELARSWIEGVNKINDPDKKAKDIWSEASNNTTKLFLEKDSLYTIHDLIEELHSIPANGQWGLNWGIASLDKWIQYLTPGEVIVIGARPGHGKTALAIQLADFWSLNGHKIFFQSLEMSRIEIDSRRLARISGIAEWKIKRGFNFSENKSIDFERTINYSAARIYDMSEKYNKFIINDKAGLSPSEISLNIKIAYEKFGINFFMLDHFQKVNFYGGHREVRHCMDEGLELILSTCKNLKITPVILSQLNRAVEGRDDREPQLTDLKECGSLEQSANKVFLMYWKYRHTLKSEDKLKMLIKCDKNRSGKTGRMIVEYIPEIYLFNNDLTEGK